ncbi:MAG: response regulator [Bryobacteraceae bacterium]|jgi:two-component system cell cycle response regulator DivK
MAESILVVDDNLDNRELTQILLECEGFEVRLAEDAPQALRMFETYRPKLILVDVQMPGMDGLELTRRLRRDPSSQDVIVVALSAYAMAAEKANALAAGCDGYITKPINTRTFASAVRRYLEVPARLPRMEQASAA